MTTITTNPAALYLANLSAGSQGMRQSLDTIARILDPEQDAENFRWQEVTYSESMAVRLILTKRYKPATVNKMLSALRGVLKQTWRLGLIDADAYHRAAAVENVRASNLLSGRALETEEIARLFETCTAARTAISLLIPPQGGASPIPLSPTGSRDPCRGSLGRPMNPYILSCIRPCRKH